MTKITLVCQGATAMATVEGEVTAGAVGIPVEIEYDSAWDGLVKTMVAMSAMKKIAMAAVESDTVVPWEVLQQGMHLYLGVEGRNADGDVIIPTTWADCGRVKASAEDGHDHRAPTPTEIEQLLQTAGEAKRIADGLRDDADNHRFDGAPGKSPAIDEDGYWVIWNPDTQTWDETHMPSHGSKGEKGDAYVITEADKQEIASEVESKYTVELNRTKEDYRDVIDLLRAVRDKLAGGDIPGAIGLLDSFLLDKEVLA